MSASSKPIRRHVFFLSGFDPKGAAYYHALYQRNALRQSENSRIEYTVGARKRIDGLNQSWDVSANEKGDSAQTQYEFLVWDDIVRKHWQRGAWRLIAETLSTYAYAIARGVLPKVKALAPRTLIGLFYPLAFLALASLATVALATTAFLLVLGGGSSWSMAIASSGIVTVLGIWLARRVEARLNTSWLARIFTFARRYACQQIPELDARLDEFARRIAAKLAEKDTDEVLIVGFSVGSILAVSATARALSMVTSGRRTECAPALSVLTLAHCLPMLSLLPEAQRFRAELTQLAMHRQLYWVDFSSPTDWGSFALVDPVDATTVPLSDRPHRQPLLRSPRFHTQFSASEYARLRRDKRRMHLQYLMAGSLPASYDYFAITAGSLTLAQRYPIHPSDPE